MFGPGDVTHSHSPAAESGLDGAIFPRREPSGRVISDLHLLSNRSTFDRHAEVVDRAIRESRMLVLNGDIFDFRWSRLGSTSESIRTAIEMLSRALAMNPDCKVHYVLGNHDRHPEFVAELRRAALGNPNLEVHSSHVRIGSNLFLHGDLPEGRTSGSHTEPASAVRHVLYDIATALGAQKLAYLTTSRDEMAEKILRYLQSTDPASLDGIENIYYGHTHVAFENHEYRGMRFHNTGAAVKGMEMSVLEFW